MYQHCTRTMTYILYLAVSSNSLVRPQHLIESGSRWRTDSTLAPSLRIRTRKQVKLKNLLRSKIASSNKETYFKPKIGTIEIVGKFRTSTKTITITNTSSFCGYVRQSRDVIFGRFGGVNEDRLPFSYVPDEHNFVHFLRFVDMFPLKMQYNFDYFSSLESLHMHIVHGFMPDRCK
jgi:hypothetical protein